MQELLLVLIWLLLYRESLSNNDNTVNAIIYLSS